VESIMEIQPLWIFLNTEVQERAQMKPQNKNKNEIKSH
jgi:hypothetical protein